MNQLFARLPLLTAPPLLLLGLSSAAADIVPLKDSVPHIMTTGQAKAEVMPDEADLRLGVSIERPQAQAATKAVAEAAAAILAEVKAGGIDAKDIRTDFELEAKYDRLTDANGRFKASKLRGYAATEFIVVRLRDVMKAGPLARVIVDKGANEFRGITFRYSKEKEKRKELAAAATRDALDNAKNYTDAIGLKLGRVLQIGDDVNRGGGDGTDLPSRRAPPVMDSPVTSVPIPTEPGVIKLVETATVIWEIEGKAP